MDTVEDYIAIGAADIEWQKFEIECRQAQSNSAHDLHAFVSSIPFDNWYVGARVMFRILVAARQDENHQLHKLATSYISPAVGARLNADYMLIQSVGMGHLLNQGAPSETMRTALSMREAEDDRIAETNRLRAKKPRPNARRKVRDAVIQNMMLKRLREPDATFAEWLEEALARGAGNDFEITPEPGGEYEISNDSGDPQEIVKRSTMANDWWVEARRRTLALHKD